MAIEASNLTEKDELIAKFYTIRAGLSVIAEESYRVKDKENEIYSLSNQDYTYRKERIQELKIKAMVLQGEVSKLKSSLYVSNYELSKLRNEYNIVDNENFYRRHISPFLCAALSVFIGFNLIPVIYEANGDNFSAGMIVLIILSIATIFVFPILIAVLMFKMLRERDEAAKREALHQVNVKILEQENVIKKTKNQIDEKNSLIDDIINKRIPEMEKFSVNAKEISALSEVRDSMQLTCSQKAKSIRNALVKEFGDIITEADWKNIDLLIYYLNTGRADSLKEALQLVDQQRQTNQIVYAIGTAASYISDTIVANTDKHARAMDNCFSNLSNQININHKQLIGAIDDVNNSINYGIASFESTLRTQSHTILDSQALNASLLLDSQALNAALLKEANRSSDELMNELRYNQKYWVK